MPKQMTKRSANRYAPYVASARKVGGAMVRAAAKIAVQRWRAKAAAKANMRHRLFQNIRPVGTGSSKSYHSAGKPPKLVGRILRQMQPVRSMNQTTSQRVEGTIGTQGVAAEHTFTVGQLQDYFTQLTSGGSNTQRLYLKKATSEILISNATSSNTFVRLYELKARRDFMTTTNSAGALSTQAIWTAAGAFDQGLYDVTSSTSNAATALGASPFQSKLFTQLWKVEKVFNIELGSGRSHKHTSSYNVNRFITESSLGTTASRRNQILGGITRAILIVTYGAPVNSDALDTNVSTAKPALNIVRHDRHYIQVVDPQGEQMYRISTLPTFTDAQEVDEEGNVQAPTEA